MRKSDSCFPVKRVELFIFCMLPHLVKTRVSDPSNYYKIFLVLKQALAIYLPNSGILLSEALLINALAS